MEEIADIKDNPPGLDLSFDWVKDVLDKQSASCDALDNKAVTLLTLATLLLTIVASFGILNLYNKLKCGNLDNLVLKLKKETNEKRNIPL